MREREGSISGLSQNSYTADRDEVRAPEIPPESTGHTAGGPRMFSPQKSFRYSGFHLCSSIFTYTPSFLSHAQSPSLQVGPAPPPSDGEPSDVGGGGSSTVPVHTQQDVSEGSPLVGW